MIPRVLNWISGWNRFCMLLTIVFVVRGVFVMSVLPPFEGWDEYQHIARLAYRMDNGDAPDIAVRPDVPHRLFRNLRRYPHSETSAPHTSRFGGRTYEEFWTSKPPSTAPADEVSIFLYQSQQGPLYYRLATPIFRALDFDAHPLRTVTFLRFLNILFGALSIYIALRCIGAAMITGFDRYLLAILIALQPLYLLNCVRVANDALAVLLGTLFIAIMLRWKARRWIVVPVAGGVILGLGVLAKATIAPLVLLGVFVILLQRRNTGIRWTQRFLALAIFGAGCAAVLSPQLYSSYENYGTLFPIQEAINNERGGKGIGEMVSTVAHIDWWREFGRRYFRHSLWVGGWSYLKPAKALVFVHEAIIAVSALGWLLLLKKKTRERRCLFQRSGLVADSAVLAASIGIGIGYHMIQSQMSQGWIATNIWYAAVSFPFLLCLVHQGLDFFGVRRLVAIAATTLAIVFLVADIHGVLGVMVPAYTLNSWGEVAYHRLQQMHATLCGPSLTIPSVICYLGLMGIAGAVVIREYRREAPSN